MQTLDGDAGDGVGATVGIGVGDNVGLGDGNLAEITTFCRGDDSL